MMASGEYLLDASAVLALVLGEPGADRVEELLDQSSIHAVNLIEVVSKLSQKGVPHAAEVFGMLQMQVIEELSVEQAELCAELHAATRPLGLSLGDCTCLGIAVSRGMTAVTADRTWQQVADRRVTVECIRA
jgi:PIN domain nuclease of toxin-antitoxin system